MILERLCQESYAMGVADASSCREAPDVHEPRLMFEMLHEAAVMPVVGLGKFDYGIDIVYVIFKDGVMGCLPRQEGLHALGRGRLFSNSDKCLQRVRLAVQVARARGAVWSGV